MLFILILGLLLGEGFGPRESGFVVSLYEALAIVVGILVFAMGLRSGLIIGAILLLTILATFLIMKMQGILLEL